jgi:hypothetical protein
MRWTLWRQVILHRTKTPAADGEVVWSWRRDPGAKPMESSTGDGGKKGRFPGESAYKP